MLKGTLIWIESVSVYPSFVTSQDFSLPFRFYSTNNEIFKQDKRVSNNLLLKLWENVRTSEGPS